MSLPSWFVASCLLARHRSFTDPTSMVDRMRRAVGAPFCGSISEAEITAEASEACGEKHS